MVGTAPLPGAEPFEGAAVRDVVERAMRGDREAFGVLVVHTSDRLYAIATRILRDTELAGARASREDDGATVAVAMSGVIAFQGDEVM